MDLPSDSGSAEWTSFLAAAKIAMKARRVFTSPVRGRRYRIHGAERDRIVVARLDAATDEILTKGAVERSISTIRAAGGSVPRRNLSYTVAQETALVELHPWLRWSQSSSHIVLDRSASEVTTYLLTWNPDRFDWDQFDNEAIALARGKAVESRWSTGNTRSIRHGSRFFLLRQGAKGRGIVASGWVIRESYQESHWDPALAAKGATANYVRIQLDAVLDPQQALDVASVKEGALGNTYWARPASGTVLKPSAARELEIVWAEWRSAALPIPPALDVEIAWYEGEERHRYVKHKFREKALRDEKLRTARAASPDGRLRCEVPGCGFDFEERYGEIGHGYAHVHHIRPLSTFDGPTPVTLADLAVVCANCHAMIHAGGLCRDLESLIPLELTTAGIDETLTEIR